MDVRFKGRIDMLRDPRIFCAMSGGDRSTIAAQLQEHGARLLRQLGFTSTVFYPQHVMPALISKASSVEELDLWHAVASRKIAEVKRNHGGFLYSEFKYGRLVSEMIKGAEEPQHWRQIIKRAETPQQLDSLISEWQKQHPPKWR